MVGVTGHHIGFCHVYRKEYFGKGWNTSKQHFFHGFVERKYPLYVNREVGLITTCNHGHFKFGLNIHLHIRQALSAVYVPFQHGGMAGLYHGNPRVWRRFDASHRCQPQGAKNWDSTGFDVSRLLSLYNFVFRNKEMAEIHAVSAIWNHHRQNLKKNYTQNLKLKFSELLWDVLTRLML